MEPTTRNDKRWPFLDCVRFGAALLVMFGHFRGFYFESITKIDAGIATKIFYVLTGIHREAVILFFVVSGFLIGGRSWELIERRRFDVSRYFLDRFTRIYLVVFPALLFILAVNWIASGFLDDTRLFGVRPLEPAGISSGWTWSQVPCHLAALQGVFCAPWGANPPLWSLGYEWAFYFLAPLLLAAYFAPYRPFARICATAIVAAAAWVILPAPFYFLHLFVIWSLGAVSARILVRASLPAAIGILGLMLAAACMIASRAALLPLELIDAGIAIGTGAALACRKTMQIRFLEPVMRRGAAFSYSLYVLHIPVGLLIGALLETLGWPRDLSPPGIAPYSAFLVSVALTLLVAHGFARLTEDHTARLRGWLGDAFSLPPAAAAKPKPTG